MCRELDATVMRAIASLLSGLPLQPEGMETDLDLAEAKSQLFLKLVKSVKIWFFVHYQRFANIKPSVTTSEKRKNRIVTNSSFFGLFFVQLA